MKRVVGLGEGMLFLASNLLIKPLPPTKKQVRKSKKQRKLSFSDLP